MSGKGTKVAGNVTQFTPITTPLGLRGYRALVVVVTTAEGDEVVIGGSTPGAMQRSYLKVIGRPFTVEGEPVALFNAPNKQTRERR